MLNRRFKTRSFILTATLIAGLGLVTHAAAQQRSFLVDLNTRTVTPLGTLGGDLSLTSAQGINDAGQIVGASYIAGGVYWHAFITGPDGIGMRDLGTLGVVGYSSATGINDAGQVVGGSSTNQGPAQAFITGPDGLGMRDLDPLVGNWSSASSINNAGQVVGYSTFPYDHGSHVFITGPGGEDMRELPTPGVLYAIGGVDHPIGINGAGQVTGSYDTAFNPSISTSQAFITGPDGVGVRDLGTLGGKRSYSEDINDAGQVVGVSGGHAFITGPDGIGMRDLGTLGGPSSEASGINDAGQVVGVSTTAAGAQHAFITGPNGADMTDLNSLVSLPGGTILTEATGINNHGQIIANGILPIPEPETYAMFMAGLGLLGFIARRRKTA